MKKSTIITTTAVGLILTVGSTLSGYLLKKYNDKKVAAKIENDYQQMVTHVKEFMSHSRVVHFKLYDYNFYLRTIAIIHELFPEDLPRYIKAVNASIIGDIDPKTLEPVDDYDVRAEALKYVFNMMESLIRIKMLETHINYYEGLEYPVDDRCIELDIDSDVYEELPQG